MSSIVFSSPVMDNSAYTTSVVKLFTPNCVHESDSYVHNNEYNIDYTSVYGINDNYGWDNCIVKEWNDHVNANEW
jgi:hypothetical protein